MVRLITIGPACSFLCDQVAFATALRAQVRRDDREEALEQAREVGGAEQRLGRLSQRRRDAEPLAQLLRRLALERRGPRLRAFLGLGRALRRRRDLRQQREHRVHLDHRSRRRLRLGVVDDDVRRCGGAAGDLALHRDAADLQLVAVAQRALAQAPAVHLDAVAAVEVAQRPAVGAEDQLGVVAGDAVVGDREVAA
jgi:hypothetical protein